MGGVLDAASEKVVGSLEEVWESIVEAGEGLGEPEWDLSTDCPGWSVRDQVSHLIGIERALLGDPAPPSVAPSPAHVKNPMGDMNEAWVQARRALPGSKVLAEFALVADRRLGALRSMSNEDFEVVGWSPIGDVPYRQFMVLRVFDSWVHEQDIRRAVGRPGGRGGPGECITLDRMSELMAYVVGRRVKPPEGATVVFEVVGPLPRSVSVAMGPKRAEALSQPPPDPTVTITLEAPDFWRLGCGRLGAEAALASESVSMAGDSDLGRRVVYAMNVMV